MSLEKIVAEAMAGRPLEMKEAFGEEIQTRIQLKLEEKYVEMMEAKEADEDEDEDEDDDDDKPAFLKKGKAKKKKADDEDEDEDDDEDE
jgi:hypothetical protein|tara:strand:- start:3241 stop:3507 length:267 start_codon:yes stop_codon:yes gene_type:complete